MIMCDLIHEIQNFIKTFIVEYKLYISIGFILLSLIMVPVVFFWFKQWWANFETRHIRSTAERRDLFLKFAIYLLIIGGLSALYSGIYPADEIGRLVFDLDVLFMAVIGFFFAVYGMQGILDRPKDLAEVLIRTTAFLRKYNRGSRCTAIMFCEYPAWGALSRQRTREYEDFVNALSHFLDMGKKRKLVLVTPNDDDMKKRIGQYATDYGHTEEQMKAAQDINHHLVNTLQALGQEMPNGIKRWLISHAPRYQMLLIGEQTTGDRGLRLLEAVVWLAPRCSDVDGAETQPPDPNGKANQDQEKKINLGEEVPILAWHTSAPDILNELYDSSFFYAKNYSHSDKPQTYKEFLANVASTTGEGKGCRFWQWLVGSRKQVKI
jgi:hypothetical protein